MMILEQEISEISKLIHDSLEFWIPDAQTINNKLKIISDYSKQLEIYTNLIKKDSSQNITRYERIIDFYTILLAFYKKYSSYEKARFLEYITTILEPLEDLKTSEMVLSPNNNYMYSPLQSTIHAQTLEDALKNAEEGIKTEISVCEKYVTAENVNKLIEKYTEAMYGLNSWYGNISGDTAEIQRQYEMFNLYRTKIDHITHNMEQKLEKLQNIEDYLKSLERQIKQMNTEMQGENRYKWGAFESTYLESIKLSIPLFTQFTDNAI